MPLQGRGPVMIRASGRALVLPSERLTGGIPSSNPFSEGLAASQHQAQLAQAALPRTPTPSIPRLPNPTPEQTHVALQLALNSQQKALGANPSIERIRAYQQELANDPRQREFRETIAHYVRAAEGHLAAMEGRRVASGQEQAGDAPTRAAAALTRRQQVALGRQVQAARPGNQVARPGTPAKGISLPLIPGGVTIPGTVGLNAAIGPKVAEDVAAAGPIASKVPGELVGLPAQTLLSLYDTGKAGVNLAKGDPAQAVAIAKGLLGQVEHPIRSFEQAPLSTVLSAAGAEAAAGGIAGAVARKGLLGDAAKAAASTAREPLQLYGGEAINRHWNSDPVRKLVQQVVEGRRGGVTGDVNQAEGRTLRREIAGGTIKPGRVDVQVDAAEQMRRSLKAEATHPQNLPQPKGVHGALAEMVENTMHPSTIRQDLQRRESRLLAAQDGRALPHEVRTPYGPVRLPSAELQKPLVGPELAANKAEVARVQALLKDPALEQRAQELHDAKEAFVRAQRPRTGGLVQVGALKAEQLRASLFPHALDRMGARFYTVEDHQAVEAAARRAEARIASRVAEGTATPSELMRAREYRMEVSGRGPVENIRAHEEATAGAAAARRAVTEARETLRKAENARSRLVGARGAARPRQDVAAADGGGTAMDAANAKLEGAREALRRAELEHGNARKLVDESTLPKIQEGLRKADGRHLGDQEILQHMRDEGFGPVGFLSHSDRLPQRGSFFKPATQRPGLLSNRPRRTGESWLLGTADHSHGSLLAQAAKEANELAAHGGTNAMLNRFGVGRYDSEAAAIEDAKNFHNKPNGEVIEHALGKMIPTLIGPKDVVAKDLVHPVDTQRVLDQFGLHQHTPVSQSDVGRYTLVPEAVLDRINQHEALRASSGVTRVARIGTQKWKQAQLKLSPRWLFGNPQEHGLRLAAEGIAPKALGGRSGRLGDRYVNALDSIAAGKDPELARQALEAKSRLIRGSIYDSEQQLGIITKADQFAETSRVGKALGASERAAETGAGKAALAPWHAWNEFVDKAMTKVEIESRKAAVGKAVREDIHSFNGQWRNVNRMTDKAFHDFVKGHLDQNTVERLVHATDEMMGAWGHLSPAVRGFVQTWSPFGLWWLTSMRWLRRLPLTHPVKTGITAALYNATAPERGKQNAGVPSYEAGGIQANLPWGIGHLTAQPTYYTPGGVAIEPAKTAVDMFAPQISGPLLTATGHSPLASEGEPIEALTKPGSGGKAVPAGLLESLLAAGAEAAESITPGGNIAKKLIGQGGKQYGTSPYEPWAVKPGTKRPWAQVLTQVLAPTRVTLAPAGGSAVGGGRVSLREQQEIRRALGEVRGARVAGGLSARERLEIKQALEAARRPGS